MALAAGAAAVNSLSEAGLMDRDARAARNQSSDNTSSFSRSEHVGKTGGSIAIRHQRVERFSITGAQLDLQWREMQNVEYLTDGGNSWIHTAVFSGKPVVVKTLKPECQDVALAINEIEGELAVHSRLNHHNIVGLIGAGTTSKGVRFVVLERLDGGTLTQMLGYDTRIRDRRRRFWRRKHFSFLDVLRVARSIAEAMAYCHEDAIPGCMVLHRDLKPDNIGKFVFCVGLSVRLPRDMKANASLFFFRFLIGWHGKDYRLWAGEDCRERFCGFVRGLCYEWRDRISAVHGTGGGRCSTV